MEHDYLVKWDTGEVKKYEALNDVVAEIIKVKMDYDDWTAVKWWADIMASGEFSEMSEKEAMEAIAEEDYLIEDIKIISSTKKVNKE